MKLFNKSALAGTAIAALLVATPAAFAQDAADQLRTDVENSLVTLDAEIAGYEYLSVEELAQLKSVLDSEETTTDKLSQIEQIIDTKAETGNAVYIDYPESTLRAEIDSELTTMGIEADVDALTLNQLVEIRAVLEGEETTESKQRQIETIIAS